MRDEDSKIIKGRRHDDGDDINIRINIDNKQRQTQTQDGDMNGDGKVTICHNNQTIRIPPEAVAGHFRNHATDTFGPCPEGDRVESEVEPDPKLKNGLLSSVISVLPFT